MVGLPHSSTIIQQNTEVLGKRLCLEIPAGSAHHDSVCKHNHVPVFGSVQFVIEIDAVNGDPWHCYDPLCRLKREVFFCGFTLATDDKGLFKG